ncbi:Fungal lipase-like domain containing protein [Parasponia andersonii]|uniref:Fungal lipase-like domain containing protein n=1 Tax=Parasponia andersonii TaxID=3476 RepID=A0A2P5BF99_PARAD|nr:Fungal lipase-like domain containing protein [Parasponia andersonii]
MDSNCVEVSLLTLTIANSARGFSSGSELANLVVTSDLPQQAWNAITLLTNSIPNSQSSLELRFELSRVGNRTIIAFVTSSSFALNQLQHGSDLVSSSSSPAKESFALFESLSSKTQFAINKASITLFDQNLDKLSELKAKIEYSIPLIVTGCYLGGSIASLFTLWLLESGNFTKAKPLCITFGSPLIGDSASQKTLAKFSWNSNFLHLASDQDPVPGILKNHNRVLKMPLVFTNHLGHSCWCKI